MAHCENLPGCPFFQDTIPNMPITAQYLKDAYCTDQPHLCARYMVAQALGKDQVPLYLFPEEITKAERIIKLHQ